MCLSDILKSYCMVFVNCKASTSAKCTDFFLVFVEWVSLSMQFNRTFYFLNLMTTSIFVTSSSVRSILRGYKCNPSSASKTARCMQFGPQGKTLAIHGHSLSSKVASINAELTDNVLILDSPNVSPHRHVCLVSLTCVCICVCV